MNSKELEHLRHSLSHLLASAVCDIFPNAKLGIGPVIENGFYYDFLLDRPLTPQDLPKIEKFMRKKIQQNLGFDRKELTVQQAQQLFGKQPFKLELIRDLQKHGTTIFDEIQNEKNAKPSAQITTYTTGNFVDLCRGGHVEKTKEIPLDGFKLTHTAGAYWRGSEKNPMLQRVYGVAFASKAELDDYLKLLAEAEKRDHKKIGAQLELFMFHQTAPGMPYWLPNGLVVYNELIKFWREEHDKAGYHEIASPLINKKQLYITSGHFEHYWQDMFSIKTPDGEEYGVKAMNCPNAMIVYGSKKYSYRDLPLRLSDTDTLHRFELSGTLNGLFRVRSFRQDDAHIFVTHEQIADEYKAIFAIVKRFYSIFNIEYTFRLGTRPKKFMGDVATWDTAEQTLQRILKESKKDFTIAEGDGAFYGPKVDILMKDALKREWQMGTIQLDFQQPKRFGLTYVDKTGAEKTPVAIHRVIYGSLERFIGVLLEHTAGELPLWLSPVQVAIIPVGKAHQTMCAKLGKEFSQTGIRTKVFGNNETVGYKIRSAEKLKIPYMLVVGDKEKKSTKLHVRIRGKKAISVMSKKGFIEKILKKIRTRALK